MSASASARLLALGPLQQRGELQQLQVADDPVGDVQIGVQAQLAQAAADPRDARRESSSRSMRERDLQTALRRLLCSGPSPAGSVGARLGSTSPSGWRPSPDRRACSTRGRHGVTNSTASACSASTLACCSAASSRREQRNGRASPGGRSDDRGRRRARPCPSSAAALRCSSTKRGCVRAPQAAPAATRWPRSGRARGRACVGGRPGSRARGRPGAARSGAGRARARPPPRPVGSISRRIQASTSRTSARLRNDSRPRSSPRADPAGGGRDTAFEAGTSQIRASGGRRPRWGYALVMDADRLGAPRSG